MVDTGTVLADLAFGLASGVMLGCVYAVIAHGLNLIWGVAKVVNIAHGEFIMLGAYGAYFLSLWFGFNPLMAAPVDAAIGLGVGLLFYFGILHWELRGKEQLGLENEMVTLVATFGLSLVVSTLAQDFWSPNVVGIRWDPGVFTLGPVSLSLGGLYVAVASVVIIALTHLFLTRTYVGNGILAHSQDITATQLMGINPTTVSALGTALGFAVTMAGGALLTVWLPVGIFPLMGLLYAPISFVIVVLGGPGKMWGSLVGGLILGVTISVLPVFLPPSIGLSISIAVALLLLIPILLFRPEGLLR